MMEKQGSLMVEAGRLLNVARTTAESAVREAGPAGMSYGKLFILCQRECNRQVPNLPYTHSVFADTLQRLRLDNMTFYRDADGSYKYS